MRIPKSYIIETANFRLRIPHKEDITHIYSATKYKGFNDGMLWEPPIDIYELMGPYKNSLLSWEEGSGYSFTILCKETMDFLGRISIRRTSEKDTWNTGFWTHPKHQRKGIMTEVLGAILDFGFLTLSANKIEACHALWNIASEKVLKRNGMKFSRYLEKGFLKDGKWIEENLLAIEKEDWEKLQLNTLSD